MERDSCGPCPVASPYCLLGSILESPSRKQIRTNKGPHCEPLSGMQSLVRGATRSVFEQHAVSLSVPVCVLSLTLVMHEHCCACPVLLHVAWRLFVTVRTSMHCSAMSTILRWLLRLYR